MKSAARKLGNEVTADKTTADSLAALIDRLALRLWLWSERHALSRLRRRWPDEYQAARNAAHIEGHDLDDREFLAEAYDKLVSDRG
jgi:hypothetical protein